MEREILRGRSEGRERKTGIKKSKLHSSLVSSESEEAFRLLCILIFKVVETAHS